MHPTNGAGFNLTLCMYNSTSVFGLWRTKWPLYMYVLENMKRLISKLIINLINAVI